MTKMRLTTDEQGRVTISYTDEFGDRQTRTFGCREDGSYVWEYRPDGTLTQPCDRLYSTGSTLFCSSRDRLPDLIRREYRAMRRAEDRTPIISKPFWGKTND